MFGECSLWQTLFEKKKESKHKVLFEGQPRAGPGPLDTRLVLEAWMSLWGLSTGRLGPFQSPSFRRRVGV